ncbi:MAG: type II toxin-antitoxin system HipA family toxin [Solirubrobacterales bacterium]|nr:type II toxin-antitoxin system HipA family toxin [Solirubrobacterales bacterium]OJU93689.1 MAG: phosphatidylinositol kinase [Solirubrobacterales bacterium 67-14]
MISEPEQAFIWSWLPGEASPVVAGQIQKNGEIYEFTYGRSYLNRPEAIPLYLPELPLEPGSQRPLVGEVAGCIADAAPDAWGQRVLLNRLAGAAAEDNTEVGLLTYLLESGSDRSGALDFQESSSRYEPRLEGGATLEELFESAERVQNGVPLSKGLDAALLHGSSIGGARPKATLVKGERSFIAKFGSSGDPFPVEKGEFMAMKLAKLAGLNVAEVELTQVMGRDVILVERFDRLPGGLRKGMVSALTILELDEVSGRYASYADLTIEIRKRFARSKEDLAELFARLTFNILVGNTDDHARNHSAFWDGAELSLTPAYDICPQLRSGGEQSQAMIIGEDGFRLSQIAGCVERAGQWQLSDSEARAIVDHQVATIREEFDQVADMAGATEVERRNFRERQFLNPNTLFDY